MNRKRHRKDLEGDQNVCSFCGEAANEKKCGKLFTSKFGFSVHQYCMFFSAALPQNGEDNDGFEGFLERDVLREIKRASRLKCCICGKKGASAGCCDLHCKRGFHFSCGVDQKYLFQFFGQFRAYCVEHRLHQNTPSYPSRKTKCPICFEPVQCRSSADILTTPCCKDVWFHRSCLQEQATVSGYFFRCAVCNDKEKFVEEMKTMGIYVPDRDAAWEDGNNFAELLDKYSRCDNQSCLCPLGRKYSTDSGDWELVLCSSCGQFGTHVGCKDWSTNPPSLLCPTCRPIHDVDPTTRPAVTLPFNQGVSVTKSIQDGCVAKSSYNRKGGRRPRKKRQHVDSDTDSDDILNVVNGLRRHAENDILNSDTNLFVQRAIAAGTAAMQTNGFALGYSSNRKRKAEDGESDDEIMITKYVPGKKAQNKCEICPKCNRRKPTSTVTRPPGKSPRKTLPSTGVSSTVGKNSRSTSTITKADVERKNAEELETESGKSEAGTGKYDAREVKVADYEVLELAAESTDTSSVLLLPSEHKPNGLVGGGPGVKKVDSISEGENEQKTKPTSSWRSSVQQLIQFFNPLSSDATKENARRLSERSDKIEVLASSKNSNVQIAKMDVDASEEHPVSSDGKSEGTGQQSATFETTSTTTVERSASVGKTSESVGVQAAVVGKASALLGKRSECRQMLDWNSNPRKGESSNGDDFITKKAVLEAVIDHAIELKNSGKELKHRCVSSC